jgi:alginate O-acetyltransferase complex protein AlgI
VNFVSFTFLLFAAATLLLYYAPPLRRHQVSLLIAASIVFYAYGQPYLLLLFLASALINAVTSFRVLRASARRERIWWAARGIIANLCILGFFKYGRLSLGLLPAGAEPGQGLFYTLLALPLPIGISFYTFHGISLLIDVVKRGDPRGFGAQNADHPPLSFLRHLHQTLLYLSFFPQLIAGPIVKAHFFFPQIGPKSVGDIDWTNAAQALVTGYFLKCVVADNLQDQTFWMTYPYFLNLSSLTLLALLFGYSMQIFADFAGYSLIAIGLAALLGYRLPQNFNFPYLSQTFSEFWTRWHMSLSAFLREYLYYPLGGNRKGAVRTYANLMMVMALGGLWHGAAISYAVWGAWHGLALVIERLLQNTWFYRAHGPLMVAIRTGIVFSFVSAAWLLFKLPHFSDVIAYVQAIASNRGKHIEYLQILSIAVFSLPVVLYHLLHRFQFETPRFLAAARPVFYGTMLAAIILSSGNANAFVYFQF